MLKEGMTKVIADFETDYADYCRETLTDAGVAFDADLPPEELSFALWNAFGRHLEVKPREVRISPSLKVPHELEEGLARLVRKFEVGENVNPHLSKAIKNAGDRNYHDALLNDWGIHHLHLGVETGSFIARTGPLLFAMVRDEAVYMIAVKKHGAWADRDLVEVVHQNWPELLPRADGLDTETESPH